tara:strand:- start:36 stop:302 length:267 start_codon:yes stop_codon:yes gene_type:complete
VVQSVVAEDPDSVALRRAGLLAASLEKYAEAQQYYRLRHATDPATAFAKFFDVWSEVLVGAGVEIFLEMKVFIAAIDSVQKSCKSKLS